MNIFLNIQLNICFKWFQIKKKNCFYGYLQKIYILKSIVQKKKKFQQLYNCTFVMHSLSFTFFKKHEHDIKGMNCLCIYFYVYVHTRPFAHL